MLIKFSELPIPFGAVLIDTEVTEEYELDDLMSKTVEEDWMVLV